MTTAEGTPFGARSWVARTVVTLALTSGALAISFWPLGTPDRGASTVLVIGLLFGAVYGTLWGRIHSTVLLIESSPGGLILHRRSQRQVVPWRSLGAIEVYERANHLTQAIFHIRESSSDHVSIHSAWQQNGAGAVKRLVASAAAFRGLGDDRNRAGPLLSPFDPFALKLFAKRFVPLYVVGAAAWLVVDWSIVGALKATVFPAAAALVSAVQFAHLHRFVLAREGEDLPRGLRLWFQTVRSADAGPCTEE